MWPFKQKKPKVPPPPNRRTFVADSTPDSPHGFGYKTTWWAIRSTDTQVVADAIGLSNAMPCNWGTGIPASYENGIFVSPPINGWVIATGFKLPPGGNDIASECQKSLLKLSVKFGESQLFSTHRVVDYHVWARAINGELIRGFGFLGESGETLWNAGDNSTETQLDLKFPDADDLASDSDDHADFDWPDEEHVMQIAGKWSVSPVELDGNETIGIGLIGFDAKLITNAV